MRRLLAIVGALLVLPTLVSASDLQPLVSPQWLAGQLEREELVVLDIRNAVDGGSRETYLQGHIPGAIHSDYSEDGWRAARDGVPAKLPEVEQLEALIGGLGIDNGTDVVIVPAGVSSTDFGSAARVYWTFKVLGHDRVAILDGGYRAWVDAGLPVAQGGADRAPTQFSAEFRPQMVADTAAVASAAGEGIQLLDARPKDQFLGREKPGPVRAAGTIPGSLNLEQQRLVHEGTAQLVDRSALDSLIGEAGLDTAKPTITFCNTGHWAAISWFALSEVAGHDNVVMYDGSMVEWAMAEDRPLQTERRGLGRVLGIFR